MNVNASAVRASILATFMGMSGLGMAQQAYTLDFRPTASDFTGSVRMYLQVSCEHTSVALVVRGAAANTVYTLWNDFRTMAWDPNNPYQFPGGTLPAGFPSQGFLVGPVAPAYVPYTNGMGMDPGSFRTDSVGNADVNFDLDYNLVAGAPVPNKVTATQCVPGGPAVDGTCPAPKKIMSVAQTWLRGFIGEYSLDQRDSQCANYDARRDKESPSYDAVLARTCALGGPGCVLGNNDARFWQCVDPGTGFPRIVTQPVGYIRLANHVDELSHGLFGGSVSDHTIDMIGIMTELH
jgi:hypothetical protein